jgi:glycine cleavage system H protein
MDVEKEMQYTKNHEWVLIKDDIATIGITDYAQKELGDIVYVDVDTLGSNLHFNDIFGSVEAVKTVSDLYMPITGEVIEINPKLENRPDLVNQSPYEEGWIIKVKIAPQHTSDQLLSLNQYKDHIGL